VPAHNYVWSWEPKKDWTAVYAGSAEIYRYFKEFSSKYNLNHYIKASHEVAEARWNEELGQWEVKIKDLSNGTVLDKSCDILINGSGILNNWKWPSIPGLKDFKGQLLHSAHYDQSVDLTGKHIGLIGNGSVLVINEIHKKFLTHTDHRSSGIQILPTVHNTAKAITTFIRTPTWIAPIQGLDQHVFSQEELDQFANVPGHLLNHRKEIETGVNSIYPMFLNGSKMQELTKKRVGKQMRSRLPSINLQQDLIPEWSFGCRRMTPGINYLETLEADNVEVVFGGIETITENGCVAGGKEYPVDILICATGFDTSFKPRFSIIGKDGKDLRDIWSTEAHSYMGVAAPAQPNYLHFLGPNCPIGSGPLVGAIGTLSLLMICPIGLTLLQRRKPTTCFAGATAGKLKISTPSPPSKSRSTTSLHAQISSCVTPSGRVLVEAGTKTTLSMAVSRLFGREALCIMSRQCSTCVLMTGTLNTKATALTGLEMASVRRS
jgi:cation diffusion facilitator CzcD-associated flavoprotein CzcO